MRRHNGLKIAAVYAAVILGAGFASGRELLNYFVGYGVMGLAGLLAAGVLFAAAGWAVLDICRTSGAGTYAALMKNLLGERAGAAAEWISAAFLSVLFAAMLAAAGAVTEQGLGLPFTLGAAAAGLLCFIVLLFDLEGLVKLNAVFAPFMVVAGAVVGLYAFFNHTRAAGGFDGAARGWLPAALVYASYNLVTGIPVLAETSRLAEKPRDCAAGGIAGGAALTLLGVCMALPLYLYYANVIDIEIPFLIIAAGFGKGFTFLFLAVMLCAVFTTAVSGAFALKGWLRGRFGAGGVKTAAALCLLGVCAAHLGFSNFVGKAYPLFGMFGMFEITVILLSWRRKILKD